MKGSRQASEFALFSPLRRLVARAMAQDLRALVIPGPDVALARGLDLAGAGLRIADSPRSANLLLLVGPLPASLMDAVSIAYAQMPRPRAILALGVDDLAPLPTPDASGSVTQEGLQAALVALRPIIAAQAFDAHPTDFDAPALQTRIQYTCPMHPEVVSDEPGSCPKCGMFLVPRETAAGGGGHDHAAMSAADGGTEAVATKPAAPAAYACPMHSEVTSDAPGSCPKCGMDLVATGGGDGADHGHSHDAPASAAYACPMHPEVTSDAPGSCTKCGMDLVATDGGGADHGHSHDAPAPTTAYACPMHPEVTSDAPGSCPKCGMDLVATDAGDGADHAHHGHSHDAATPATTYVCPMHPEVTSDEPGNCPKCGMDLVPADAGHSADQQHVHGHDHGDTGAGTGLIGLEPGFMSMIEMTEGTPRSSDGLQMEWIDAPFGPFFPGLPGGLTLVFTLDGDSVVAATAGSLVAAKTTLPDAIQSAAQFVSALQARMPLAPVSYALLACRAIEAAARTPAPAPLERARDAALERERIASHLIWLAQMGRQVGLVRVARQATALHLSVRDADQPTIRALMPGLNALLAQVRDTRFLTRRMAVVGTLPTDADWGGPASPDNSAAGRLAARLTEISASIGKIDAAPAITPPRLGDIGKVSGQGHASVQTPRGPASLDIEITDGQVVSASLKTPSARHLALVAPLCEHLELADALVAVASLDLDPWEIDA